MMNKKNNIMSKKQIEKNNKNHWDWEIKYNNFIPANADLQKLEEYKTTIKI